MARAEIAGAARGRVRALLERLGRAGGLPTDTEEERLRKAALVLFAVFVIPLSTVWVTLYLSLGLEVSAAIPATYQVASLAALAHFLRTKRFPVFRTVQIALMLVLPFAVQWTLGGFVNGSAVALWALMAPIGALVFHGTRPALPWFGAYAALVVVFGILEPRLAAGAPELPDAVRYSFFVLNIGAPSATAFLLLAYFVRQRDREHARSERLLLNVLPAPIAARLKQTDGVIAEGFPEATVLFADIAGFTPLSAGLPPERVVALLDEAFSAFDRLADERGLEKIKTIGDAYMVAGGIPVPRADHAEAVAEMALAMLGEIERCARTLGHPLALRIGIDSGPVVAGVIGRRKFIYDLWGDTVNTASRMESHGLPGQIQVTARARERLRHAFVLESRGPVEVKGKGTMETWLLLGRHADAISEAPSSSYPAGAEGRAAP